MVNTQLSDVAVIFSVYYVAVAFQWHNHVACRRLEIPMSPASGPCRLSLLPPGRPHMWI